MSDITDYKGWSM